MYDIYVEVRPKPTISGDLVAPRASAPEALTNRIDEIGDSMKAIALSLSGRLSEFAPYGDENWRLGDVELKFSLDLEAEAGVIIARTSATAGFEVTLVWKAKQINES